jgi:AcrR family transcriptional regulator
MPANRSQVDHDAKAAEILDAAEALLIAGGYEATTMAAVAARAGISSNAVYWYFPGKDELFAAVLRRRRERGFAGLEERGVPLRDRALAALAELDSIANLTAAVHERARHSEAVAEAHREFHEETERRVREGFAEAGLGPEDARLAAAGIIAMVEGIHLHDEERDPGARDELVLWTLRKLLGRDDPPDS